MEASMIGVRPERKLGLRNSLERVQGEIKEERKNEKEGIKGERKSERRGGVKD